MKLVRYGRPGAERPGAAAAAPAGGPANGLAAHLVTPDMTATPGTEPARPGQATAMTTRPAIVSRAGWGADESLRRHAPEYSDTVKAAFVHHTVQANSYAPSESAALIRADYVYHVRSRGWNDIGYNFLVDRYGRVFEGRYGGVTKAVLGAHAGGFNTDTTGVALLGTFTTARAPAGMVAALERLLAWKLDLTHVDPLGLTALWKFMAGRGTHEKVLAQLKNGYAFDTVPTRNFAANSTWQILSVLAHNLITNFQIALAAPPRPASSKRRSLFLLRSIHTLRYEFLGRAGMVRHPEGRAMLTLAPNLPTQKLFESIVAKLASAA